MDTTKFQELQDKLVEAAKNANQEAISELKSEVAELRKKASRFNVAEQDSFDVKSAAQEIARHSDLSRALKTKGAYQLELGQHLLTQKAVTYNPATYTASGDIRNVLAATYRPGMVLLPIRPPSISDLLTSVPTKSEFIHWVTETGMTNSAASVADLAAKPESAVALKTNRLPVETVATYIKCPRQLADDIPAFEGYLEKRLSDMVRLKLEDLYLFGDGTSPNILGITLFSGIQTYAQTATENKIDAIRGALNMLENSFYPWADAIMLHPNDAKEMELIKDADRRYLWPTFGSFATGYNNKTLFGVPVISTTAITEGTFLLGNFGQGTTLYTRDNASIQVSFHDQDDFIKNRFTILCESRVCLVPEYPKCFVLGSFQTGNGYD